MIYPVGATAIFAAGAIASKVGKTGLSAATWELYWSATGASWTLKATGQATVEVAIGAYAFAYTLDAVGCWIAIFQTADATVDQKTLWSRVDCLPQLAFLDAAVTSRSSHSATDVWSVAHATLTALAGTTVGNFIMTKLGFLSSGVVTVVSPLNADGDELMIMRGDDYNALDGVGSTIDLSPIAGTTWPDLTAAVCAFTARDGATDAILCTGTVTVITPTGASAKVRVTLTAAQTLLLPPRSTTQKVLPPKWDVQATLSSTRIKTLAHGTIIVLEDQTRPA